MPVSVSARTVVQRYPHPWALCHSLPLTLLLRETRGVGWETVYDNSPLFLTQVTHIKTIHQEDELIEIQSDTGTWYQRWGVRALSLGGQVMGD